MNNADTKRHRPLRHFILYLPVVLTLAVAGTAQAKANRLIEQYIVAWKGFYPSAALAYGDAASAAGYENYSETVTAKWLALNEATVDEARVALQSENLGSSARIDLRILQEQAEDELANWREDRPLEQQPQWYAEQASQVLTYLLVRDQLSAQDRSLAMLARLRGVQRLCKQGVETLIAGNALRTESALRTLAGTREFYTGNLQTLTATWTHSAAIAETINETIASIADLERHLRVNILPGAPHGAAMELEHYAAKLARRTSGLYTPKSLLQAAEEEVQAVRALMEIEAERWWAAQPQSPETDFTPGQLLAESIAAMESDRQYNRADFLNRFVELTFAAQHFVEEHRIASVPKPTTLTIELSPAHFSGAAVGGVYPAGPFSPQSDTLFYVPSIPTSASPATQEGFYRSFNTHFNTMIMSHEMFPGHYLQYKVAVSAAPAVRSLFANGSYVEGWGSFSEELMLNAGWAGNAPLTRLAHLRKRLENATRAYVSVKVNTAGWGEEQVLAFAADEGLLAPQFAKNLWQRVVNSPMQITDYFTGYHHFRRLFAAYQLSPKNDGLQPWVDAVLRAGPVPPVMLSSLLREEVDTWTTPDDESLTR